MEAAAHLIKDNKISKMIVKFFFVTKRIETVFYLVHTISEPVRAKRKKKTIT